MPSGRPGTRKLNPHGIELFSNVIAPVGARCLVYRRKSAKLAEGDVSLEEQDTTCQRLIEELKLVQVGDIWEHNAEGVDPDRPGFRKAIELGHAGFYDVLLVWRSDRLFRGVASAGPVALLLQETQDQIKLLSCTDRFDRKWLGVVAAFGDHERDSIRQRTMDMRIYRARHGELMAGVLPYWIGRDDKNHGMLIADRADIMVQLIERYVAGERTRPLAVWMRIAAPKEVERPDLMWSADRISRLLHHTALYGELPYSRTRYSRKRHPDTGNKMRLSHRKDADEVVIIPVPPLLHKDAAELALCAGCERDTRPTYMELQDAIKAKGTQGKGRWPKIDHPLRRRVFCGVCGHTMNITARVDRVMPDGSRKPFPRTHMYLRCATSMGSGRNEELAAYAGTHRCRTPALLVLSTVWEQVKELLQRRGLADEIDAAAEAWTNRDEPGDNTLAQRLAAAEAKVKEADQDEANLWKEKNRGGISEGAYEINRKEILVTKAGAEQEVERLTKQLNDSSRSLREVESARGVARRLRAVPWDQLTDTDWGDIARAVIRQVVIDRDNQPHLELNIDTAPALHIAVAKYLATSIRNNAA
jgi:DNA invertase Pin-like site-specific DNA recombinase